MDKPRALLFDVNETLLDIRPLEAHFADWFDNGAVMRLWFGQLVMHSQSLTLSGQYVGFGALAKAVLTMIANIRGVLLPEGAGAKLVDHITSLGPHEDVVPALERLRDAGYRMAALTNSSSDALQTQIRHAGLAGLLPDRISVEAVRRYKPDPAPYRYAAGLLELPIAETMLVACHGWDTLGAAAAGCRTAFVTRPGCAPIMIEEVKLADMVVDDLRALADRLC